MTEPGGWITGRGHAGPTRQPHPLHGVAGRDRSRRLRRLPRAAARSPSRTSHGSGTRSGTTSTSRRRSPPDAVLGNREMPGAAVVSRRHAELRRPRSSGTRPTSGPPGRRRRGRRDASGRGRGCSGRRRAFAAYLRGLGVGRVTGSSGTCPTSARPSSPFLGRRQRRCDLGGVQPGPGRRRRDRAAGQVEPAVLVATDGIGVRRQAHRPAARSWTRSGERCRHLRATVRGAAARARRPTATASRGRRRSNRRRPGDHRRCRSGTRCG